MKTGYGTRDELAAAFNKLPEPTDIITQEAVFPSGEVLRTESKMGNLLEESYTFWLGRLPCTPIDATSNSVHISIADDSTPLEPDSSTSASLDNPV
jgi:hypothetical protein